MTDVDDEKLERQVVKDYQKLIDTIQNLNDKGVKPELIAELVGRDVEYVQHAIASQWRWTHDWRWTHGD